MSVFDRPPIDWDKPVQFMSGEPCTAERVQGYILISFDPNQTPRALQPFMDRLHYKDSITVTEDEGYPHFAVHTDADGNEEYHHVWVENVEAATVGVDTIEGLF